MFSFGSRVTVTFDVTNASSRVHSFAILGRRTPGIKPGHSAKLVVILLARGVYEYRDLFDKARTFRGLFIVY